MKNDIVRIIEIKRTINLALVKLADDRNIFVSKSELPPELVTAYWKEVKEEGGDQA